MRFRPLVVGVVAAAAVSLSGLIAYEFLLNRPLSSGAAAHLGGPFTLVDESGRTVTEKDLEGKPTAIYFGFTYCPEVCPTTLTAMTSWIQALGPEADKLNFVFVTIDPERDTPKQMALYLTAFDPHIRGLTGTPVQVANIAREYGVYIQKEPLPDGGYTMDHSSAVYLMDARGQFSGVITYQEPADRALANIRALLNAR